MTPPSAFINIHHEAVQSPRVMPAPHGMHRAPERWQPAAKPHCTEQEKFGKNREQEPGITSAADGNKRLSGSAAVNRAGGSFALQRALCRETACFGCAKTNVSVQGGSVLAAKGQAGHGRESRRVHVCVGVGLCARCIPEIWGCAWIPGEARGAGKKGLEWC